MFPDYRGARAIQDERLATAEWVNRGRPENPGRHSMVERFDLSIEGRLHEYVEKRRNREHHHWHWPHPLAH